MERIRAFGFSFFVEVEQDDGKIRRDVDEHRVEGDLTWQSVGKAEAGAQVQGEMMTASTLKKRGVDFAECKRQAVEAFMEAGEALLDQLPPRPAPAPSPDHP